MAVEGIPSRPSERFRRRVGSLFLEVLFWGPLWLVPTLAELATGGRLSPKDMVAALFLTLAFAALGTFLGRGQFAYRLAIFAVLGFGALIVTGMALSANGLLNPLAMLAIIDTSRSEATEFVGGNFGLRAALLMAILLVPLAALVVEARLRLLPARAPFLATAVVGLFVVQIGARYADHARLAASTQTELPPLLTQVWEEIATYPADRYPPVQPYFALAAALSIRSQIAALARTARPVADAHVPPPGPKHRTYVVVVGESLARSHMHLYGYARETTPRLDALEAAHELVRFDDIVTPHAMTVPALLSILRFHPGRGHDGQTLFDLLNGAGFKTYWISNQYAYGVAESAVSLMTSAAGSRIWLNQALEGRYEERRNSDADMLPALRKVMSKDEDQVIFLHLMGSHFSYRDRYPPSYEHFGTIDDRLCRSPAQLRTINEYDNSVRFNDEVVGRIIDQVRDAGRDSFVLYFSDHGEEVYDFRDFKDHIDSMLSPYMAEIPLVLWFSPEYRRRHADEVARVAAARERPYVTSDLLYSIADLAQIDFPGMDDSRSLFADGFEPRPRMTADRDYDAFARNWAPDTAHAGGAALLGCTAEPGVQREAKSRLASPAE